MSRAGLAVSFVRPMILEARVLAAVDARRSGTSPEDDFTECKATWPEPEKARQLAALANRAAGEPVVYIIGLDDQTGAVTNPGAVDPADWWPGLEKQFDEVAPEVLLHMSVCVDAGEYVHAFAFDTSRVPYVIKTPTGRDVPMRAGTRTRSASRSELLRLLLPSIRTPPATLLAADLSANWRGAQEADDASQRTRPVRPAQPEQAWLAGNGWCFVEQLGSDFVMLPSHGMRGHVRVGEWRGDLDVTTFPATAKDARAPSPHGVEVRADGVLVTGPGSFRVLLQGSIALEHLTLFGSAGHVELSLQFDVVGSNRPVRADGLMPRIERSWGPPDTDKLRTLGRFSLG